MEYCPNRSVFSPETVSPNSFIPLKTDNSTDNGEGFFCSGWLFLPPCCRDKWFPPALLWCGAVSPHAGAPIGCTQAMVLAILQCGRAFHSGRLRSALKGYHRTSPVFFLQLAAFFQCFVPQETTYHTCLGKSLLKGVSQCGLTLGILSGRAGLHCSHVMYIWACNVCFFRPEQ